MNHRNVAKSFLLFFLSTLLLSLYAMSAYAARATLTWSAGSDPKIAGYNIHYGTKSRTYTQSVNAGSETSYTIVGLEGSTEYYFAATAYNAQGVQSGYSNEVSYTTPTNCTYTISPTAWLFPPPGGAVQVMVITQRGCDWTATGTSWTTITSKASGTGSGTVKYSVPADNSAGIRTAATTIAGRIFTITQVGR